MQYTGGSLYQGVSLESIVAGLTGATGVEGVILSNHADFTTKNTTATAKNTTQDNTLSSLETKATGLEAGATGLEGRNATLSSDFVTLQNREDALLAGLTGASGLEARAVGFNNNITSINANLNGNIQNQINTKVADSIFQALKTEFETDFTTFQNQLNQKVVTATQEVIDARQDTDDAVLEKKFCSIEEFAQTFLQTYTVKKADGTNYNFNGKIQKIDKAPPIFSLVEKKPNGTSWDLKIKLTDYGYNVMSGNIIVKGPTGTVLHTLPKSLFNSTTKLYTLTLLNSNSNGALVNGPFTFEYQASTSTAVYSLIFTDTILSTLSTTPLDGSVAWGKWVTGEGNDKTLNCISGFDGFVYVAGTSAGNIITDIPGNKQTSRYVGDMFLIKYNPSGSAVWGKWMSYGNDTRPIKIHATSTGLYMIAANSTGNYLIKISTSDGSIAWQKTFSIYAGLQSLFVSSDGIYIGGYASQNVTGLITGKTTSTTINESFIAKLSITGDPLWSKWMLAQWGAPINGISVTSEGVYVTGNAVDFVAGVTPAKTTPTNEFLGYIVKYSPSNGASIWGKWLSTQYGSDVSVTNDKVYVMGYSSGGSTGNSVVFKYELTGELVWTSGISGFGRAISVVSDSIYIGGFTNSNSGPLYSQIIVAKLSTVNGQVNWNNMYGGYGSDILTGVYATTEGVYISGTSGGGLGSTFPGITGAKPYNDNDPFILKLV